MPYPIYPGDLSVKAPAYVSGDFQLIVNAKSIDGEDENSVEQFNLNFSINPISQGSDLTIVSSESQIKEANPLVPVDITITPEDTDGSEKSLFGYLYISLNKVRLVILVLLPYSF